MREVDRRALAEFDTLPDSARIRLPVLMRLFSISPATIWRWCASHRLPKPRKIGGVTFWSVGEVRSVLERDSSSNPATHEVGSGPDP